MLNPPTVEGWHTGPEWINSGTLIDRINFASGLLGNTELPGVRSMINRLMSRGETMTAEQLYRQGCAQVRTSENSHCGWFRDDSKWD